MGRIKSFLAGYLIVEVLDTKEEMGYAAALDSAARINKIIASKGSVNAVFAAAPSQNEFLEHLITMDIDWSKVNAFHLDEYIGLDKDAPQGFGNFLYRAIFSKVKMASVNYIGCNNSDPQAAAKCYSDLLEKNKPDIVFMGIGENGHLAFNDPHVTDFDDPLRVKVVELDNICRTQQVNDGCFKSLEEVPKYAITLTISTIIEIPEAVVVVPGPSKSNAIYNTLNENIAPACPATILRRHKNAVLYTDREGGSKVI